MILRAWFRPPRHILALFALIVLVPASVMTWLAWRVLEQDSSAAVQAQRERLDNASSRIASRLQARFTEFDDRLPSPQSGDDALALRLHPSGVEVRAGGPLLYHPTVPAAAELSPAIYETAEIAELRERDYSKAIQALQGPARSADTLIKSEALLRLARNYRKNNQPDEALRVYQDLARLEAARSGSGPAGLVAQHGMCSVLEHHQPARLRECGSLLTAGLKSGRWIIDRASFEFHMAEAQRWSGSKSRPDISDALVLAEAVDQIWNDWRHGASEREETRRRTVERIRGSAVLILWRGSAETASALVAGPRWIRSAFWMAWDTPGVLVAFTGADGNDFAGDTIPGTASTILRSPLETHLPWALRLANGTAEVPNSFALRRRMILSGLLTVALLVAGGSYFITRAVSRELATARLQADFVSAVSHEFRTPLTAMRHLIDVLVRSPLDEERRQKFFGVLAHETERLHRLVEGLLDFGRMEAGRAPYTFHTLDAGGLVRELIDEFRAEVPARDHQVELSAVETAVPVRADKEALFRAVWNLLDNAVKYSPGAPAVWVEVEPDEERVAIRVRDLGPGIPPEEQQEIFGKFVRGKAAREGGVKGTGIGLAMVQHIIRAHGGEVRLRSAPGEGSTFTLLLPLEKCV